jgi:hypothetical protein
MKNWIILLQFKLASWLYKRGIIAPQLLEHPDGTPVTILRFTSTQKYELWKRVKK